MKRIIVGISGATGAIFGIRMIEALKSLNIETHVILSQWAKYTIPFETDYSLKDIENMASVVYKNHDQAAAISSGSFITDGMIIAPCSMKTLASISTCLADNLLACAAYVVLKEDRILVLVPRETPLNAIHLENMAYLSKVGVSIVPPMPAFYNHPKSVDDIVNHIVARTLDQFRI